MSRRRETSVVLVFNLLVFAQAAQRHADTFAAIQDDTKKLHALFDIESQ
jgi:hypothetical protein